MLRIFALYERSLKGSSSHPVYPLSFLTLNIICEQFCQYLLWCSSVRYIPSFLSLTLTEIQHSLVELGVRWNTNLRGTFLTLCVVSVGDVYLCQNGTTRGRIPYRSASGNSLYWMPGPKYESDVDASSLVSFMIKIQTIFFNLSVI